MLSENLSLSDKNCPSKCGTSTRKGVGTITYCEPLLLVMISTYSS